MDAAPPERIELPDVGAVLRRTQRDDLDALQAAIEASRDHLRPFMPWADQSRQDTSDFIDLSIKEWEDHTGFGYLVVDTDDDEPVLGGCKIHLRVGPDATEIGYWLAVGATGRGIVTATAAALAVASFDLPGVVRVEIHCDEANVRSAAVPRRLGFRLERIEGDHVSAPGDVGRLMIWVIGRSEAGELGFS
ncbi:MAG: GNAT family N-acetyltransferase [Ilumatobacteraceae bacterium]